MIADVVWCDFGGVLTPPIAEAVVAVERAYGIPWPRFWAAADRVARAMGSRGIGPLETGMLTQADWAARVAAELPGGVPRGSLASFDEVWYSGREVADPVIVAALRQARSTGARIGLLTNSVREWEVHRERMLASAGDVFDAYVRSHEVGFAKPDRAIYDLADRTLPPGSGVLLIDDSRANVAAARARGWSAEHHRTAATTARRIVAATSAPTAT